MLIHSAVITGSIQINDTDVSHITGSAGFATTSSVDALVVKTGSYATTSSNQFNGDQTITGSLTTTNTITAQTLVVQTVTSSIEFVTGSTKNGSILTNTHQFTGSVGVTGSLSINGSPAILTNQTSSMSVATASYWSGSIINAATASYVQNAQSASYWSGSIINAATASYVVTAQTASYVAGAVHTVTNPATFATTASYIINAQSASYWSGSIINAATASYVQNAQTASYIVTAQTASYVANAVSSSYAATSSYANNLTVGGTLTAQTINVQTITSSIEFVTGSTRNGSLSSNTHEFTGSVGITGSAAALLNVNNGVLYVSASGDIGIGVTSISPISTYKTLEIRGATGGGIKLGKTGFSPLNIQHDGTDAYINNVANGAFNIYTNDTPRLYISSSGKVGIGTTSPTEVLDVNGSVKASSGVYGNFLEGEFGQVLSSVSYGGTTISKNLAELDPGAYLIHAYMMRGGGGVNETYSVLWYYMHLSGFGGGSDAISAIYSNPGPQNNNGAISLSGYTVSITWGGARGPAAVTALKLRDGY
jgi:hypothetical protein